MTARTRALRKSRATRPVPIGPALAMLLIVLFSFTQLARYIRPHANALSACDVTISSIPYTLNQAGKTYCLENNLTGVGGFTVSANNITLDGNGKTATVTSGDAVNITDRANIIVKNLNANQGVSILGDNADSVIVEGSTFNGISVYAADDVVIRNNTINGGLTVAYWFPNNNPAERATVSGNTITGSGTRLIDIVGYGNSSTVYAPISPGSPEAESLRRCPLTQHTVTNNTVTNTIDSTLENPLTIYLRCGRGNVVSGNTIRATSEAQGLVLRDGANFNTVTNNTVWVNRAVSGARGALAVVSGNEGADFKGYPSNNTFSGNVIRADDAHGLWLQALADNNSYANNLIWSYSGVGSILTFGQGNTFDHNTFYNSGVGSAIELRGAVVPGVNALTNNIFVHGGTNTIGHSGTIGYAGYVGHHNLFFNRNQVARFFDSMNLSDWQTTSGEQSSSFEGDPLLTDAANGDFSLDASSPARGAGAGGSNIGASVTAPLPVCTESWQCGEWSACASGQQMRTCTDQNACGTTINRPSLVQLCNTPGGCGSVCTGCTDNRILATPCTTSRRQCDGTNSIEDIRVSSTTISPGSPLTVTIDYSCYPASPPENNVALWYYNGADWKLIQHWAAPLTGCDTMPETDGTLTATFTPDSTVGTHYLRAISAAGNLPTDPLASASSCPDLHSGNIDDYAFYVAEPPRDPPHDASPPALVPDLLAR